MNWEPVLVDRPWVCAAIWAAVFIADHQLTHVRQRIRRGGDGPIRVRGQLELNPMWQRDVTAGRMVTARWVATLIVVAALILAAGRALPRSFGDAAPRLDPLGRALFAFLVGALVFVNLAQVSAHIGEIAAALHMRRHAAEIEGQVLLPRSFGFQVKAGQMLGQALLPAMGFALTGSPFLAGGTFGFAAGALAVRRWWRRVQAAEAATPPAATPRESSA